MQAISTKIKVYRVTTFQDEQAFLDLPKRIYQDDPNWVPPLRKSIAEIFTPDNPFFKYGELERFLAVREGEVVGRIVSAINRNLIEVEKTEVGLFGFFECVEELKVAQVLLETAQQWLLERGMKVVRGPINLSTDQLCLFLTDGFNSPPMFNTTYNPPYYPQFMEQLGWHKAKNAVGYIMDMDIVPSKPLRRGYEIAKKAGLTFRRINTDSNRFEAECQQIYHLLLDSYADTGWSYSYSPPTEMEFLRNANQLRNSIDLNGVWIAEDPTNENQMVGVIVGIPDYNMVLRHLNGSLNWWGKLKFLWYRRTINQARVILIASLLSYRRKMVSLALIFLILKHGQKAKKYRRAELSWVWEDNLPSRKLIEASGGKVYKSYCLYEKVLKGNATKIS